MSLPRTGPEPPTTVAAELAELGQAHLARWLDAILPPGPCLVWAGGPTLAAVLAADRRRPVLLVEPRAGDLEGATRRASAGVMLGGPGDLADHDRFDSAVIVAGDGEVEAQLGPLLGEGLRAAAVAVVVDPGRSASVAAALDAAGYHSTTALQHARVASAISIDRGTATAETLHGMTDDEPTAVVVLAGAEAHPSVLVGRDAGPSRWWTDVEWVRRSVREADAEFRSADFVRIGELEAQVAAAEQRLRELEGHADGLRRRIADIEASTSWRVSAPLRWLSEQVRRR